MQMNIHSCLCDETLITSVKSLTVGLCSSLEQMLEQFCQQSPHLKKEKTNKHMCQMFTCFVYREVIEAEIVPDSAAKESHWKEEKLL